MKKKTFKVGDIVIVRKPKETHKTYDWWVDLMDLYDGKELSITNIQTHRNWKGKPIISVTLDSRLDGTTWEFDTDWLEKKPEKEDVSHVFNYQEPETPEFDENCTSECTPGDHKCGKK